jgi:hypothetical protein
VPEGRGTVEVVLGFRYRSDAAIIDDDDPAPGEDPLRASGRPGFEHLTGGCAMATRACP